MSNELETIEGLEDFVPPIPLNPSNPIFEDEEEVLDPISEYIKKKHFYIIVNENLRVALSTIDNGSEKNIFEIPEEDYLLIQGKFIDGYIGFIDENFIELLQNYENIEDIITFDNGITITPISKTPEQLQIELLLKENADLLLDSAIKDTKIENLQNDIADIMKEMVKGGQT